VENVAKVVGATSGTICSSYQFSLPTKHLQCVPTSSGDDEME